LSAFPIPIPPLNEQGQLIQEIENRLSLLEIVENETERNLFRADRLRQSILKKAFSGQLVPSTHEYESEAPYELPMAAEAMPNSYSIEINRKA